MITISRQFGAGGGEVAHALGSRLGWPVLDSEVPRRVGERLGFSEEAIRKLDELPPPLLQRLAAALFVVPAEAPVTIIPGERLDPDAVAAATRAVVEDAGRSTPLIVVGHGGQAVFRDRPGTLHVRVVAPVRDRLRRVCRRFGCDDRFAAGEVRRTDEGRREYLRRYHQIDWDDPLLYDVQFNTARVPVEAAAEMIGRLVAEHPATEADTVPASRS